MGQIVDTKILLTTFLKTLGHANENKPANKKLFKSMDIYLKRLVSNSISSDFRLFCCKFTFSSNIVFFW